jgi:hypothetical protein
MANKVKSKKLRPHQLRDGELEIVILARRTTRESTYATSNIRFLILQKEKLLVWRTELVSW